MPRFFGPEFMNPLMRVSENQAEGAERSDTNEGANLGDFWDVAKLGRW